jgi:hypothetical protein
MPFEGETLTEMGTHLSSSDNNDPHGSDALRQGFACPENIVHDDIFSEKTESIKKSIFGREHKRMGLKCQEKLDKRVGKMWLCLLSKFIQATADRPVDTLSNHDVRCSWFPEKGLQCIEHYRSDSQVNGVS